MKSAAARSAGQDRSKHGHVHLQKVPPPPEPQIAYPEPDASSAEIMALVRGKTFLATNYQGDLMPPGAPRVGFFCDDTRFLSHLEFRIDGAIPTTLSRSTEDAYANRIESTVKSMLDRDGLDMPINTIYVHREQVLERSVLYDTVLLKNFHQESMRLHVEMEYDADFMDIFQVRGIIRGKSGQYYAPIVAKDRISFVYDGLDKRVRFTTICFAPDPTKIKDKVAQWTVDLEPMGVCRIAVAIHAHSESREYLSNAIESDIGSREHSLAEIVQRDDLNRPLERLREQYGAWSKECTGFYSDNDIFNALLASSSQDFHALQIPNKAGTAVAAGVPWFAALFGRDSLIASFQSLILNPALAQGTLRVLASYQGQKMRDDRDEEPGKILHEMRSGEMTATGEVAFGKNYGSIDATPLFLILLGEYHRWTGDDDLIQELAKPLTMAVEWLLTSAEIDEDCLIGYRRKNGKGLLNQGWKDSGDSMMHADGHLAQPPIELIEVQGYAIRALSEASAMLQSLGIDELSARASERSSRIRCLIDRMFWMERRHYYAMALDKNNRQLEVIASNPGHLLFSRAVTQERAADIVKTLLNPGLFSGWGIRTLSREEKTYNPMSYHRGSIWPHDNSLIAYGMARYGFNQEASIVFTALYEAALHFRDYRLPELFCGIQRRERDEPVQYPVSCSPQAWASGTPLLLLTALLGLRPDAGKKQLRIVNPCLPEFLGFLRMENFRIGKSRITLEFQRQSARTFCHVVDVRDEPLIISIDFR